MIRPALAVAAAAVFMWLGMVLAISFLEAPLKFRAPGVTLPIGLGIGRLVFRALNVAELVVAAALVVGLAVGRPGGATTIVAAVPVILLLIQVLVVRPRLTRRSDAVIAGENVPRSTAHHAYIVAEVAKVVTLVAAGVLIFTA